MNKGKHTVSSIADALGVSRASVSRALNNSPGVGTELRKQILEYAEQIGYKTGIPSPEATTTKSNVIGLVFGDIQNPFYSDLAYHVQKTLNEHGYSVIIFNSEYDPEKEIEFIEMADKFQLAGLLLFTTQTNMDYLYVQSRKIPIVFVNRFLDLKNYDSVISDNFQAGYIAAMHLIELGHKRLGFISGHRFSSASTRRLEGFKQALRNCLLPVNEEDFMEGDLKMTTGAEVARQFLERDSQPTGIAIANDMMALGFLDYCKSVNLSIPQDLSVISFDDIVFSKLHGIELTTVSQHGKDMGEKAAQLILRRIKHPDADYKKIILEPSLIVRHTTAPYKH